MKTQRFGGLLLMLGSILVLGTIFFEYQIGWIGEERTYLETSNFIYKRWPDLKLIWVFQMLGQICLLISFLLLQYRASLFMKACWYLLAISTFMMVIAFGFTLSTYGPALNVYDTNPEVFNTLREGIGKFYVLGRYGGVLYIIAFLYLTFSKSQIISKWLGIATITFVAVAILIGIATPLTAKVTGASWLLFPFVMGLYYYRNGKSLKNNH